MGMGFGGRRKKVEPNKAPCYSTKDSARIVVPEFLTEHVIGPQKFDITNYIANLVSTNADYRSEKLYSSTIVPTKIETVHQRQSANVTSS